MTTIPIGRPGSGGGGTSGFDLNEHLGHSVAFVNNEERTEIPTRHGTVDRVAVSEYVVCITDGGKVYREHMTFGKALVPSILAGTEAVVLGTIGKGDAAAGKSAAWLLFDPTDAEVDAASTWFAQNGATLPSGRIVIEEPQPPEQTESF